MSFEGNNFINNNFFWFTGVIEDINDPMEMGRVRVRCFGYHTDDKSSGTGIPTESLPWGHVMMPITSASCSGIGTSATGILQGSWVVGFFRDGEACQDPLIIGTLPSHTHNPLDRTKGFCDPAPNGNPRDEEYIDNPKGSTAFYQEAKAYILKDDLRHASTKYQKTPDDSPTDVPTAVPPGTKPLKLKYPDADGKPDPFFDRKTFIQPQQQDICKPVYPNCHTTETIGGHTIEIDDTKGAERLLTLHKTGSYEEIDYTGTRTVVIVGDDYEICMKGKNVNIKGACNVTINGEARTLVKGDYYLEVEGNHYTNIHGMKHTKVGMSEYIETIKDKKENIGGLLTTRIGKNERRTVGANKKSDEDPGDSVLEIFGSQELTVNENRTETISKSSDTIILESASFSVNNTFNMSSQGNMKIETLANLDIDGKTDIDIACPADIDINGGTINLN
jgi:hypothetical protein